MNFRRRLRILESRKSPSTQMMKRTYNRAFVNGGVVQDFTDNVENLRVLSRTLGYDNVDRGGVAVRRNMIQWSESFDNALWVRQNTAISINVITAPDGNTTAEKFIANSTNAFHLVYQLVSGGVVNTTYTASMYAKAGEVSNIAINNSDGIVGLIYSFDLISGTYIFTNGTIGTSTASITNVGNGWWRCSVTRTMGSTIGSLIGFQINGSDASNNITYSGDNTSGLYLWGFQYEKDSIATEYQATTTSVVYPYLSPAAFTYVPTSYAEGKNFTQVHNKRNLLNNSEIFTAYSLFATTVTSNSTSDPFGFNNGTFVKENSATALHYISYAPTGIPLANITYTYSLYAKPNGRNFMSLFIYDGVNSSTLTGVTFNVSNGTVGYIGSSVLSYTITLANNGWYRCSIVIKVSASANINANTGIGISNSASTFLSSYAGDNVSGIYIYGAQLEKSLQASQYQKTVGSGDGIVDFNFTRATTATTTNKLGYIDDSCYNLLTNSEVYTGANWTKEAMTATANATIAPNGTLTATKLASSSGGGYCRLYLTALNVYLNNTYTHSFYVKAAELNFVHIRAAVNSGSYGFCVNLTTAAITQGYYDNNLLSTLPSIRSAKLLPNGWIYVSYTFTATSPNSAMYIHISPSATNTTNTVVGNGVYFAGSQVALGSLQRPYLKTTNRLNVPRLDYKRSLIKPSLLTERSATNFFLQSDNIGTSWLNDCAVVKTLNTIISPDSQTTADKLAEFNGSGAHDSYQSFSATSGVAYTVSGYFKPAGRNNIVLTFNNSPITAGVNFNISTGIANTPIIIGSATFVSSKITLVQGFYRCEFTVIVPSTATYYTGVAIGLNDADDGSVRVGDGTSGIYVWGMQLEVGKFASSYIPTTTATVTRNVETNYVDLWNNGMLNKTNWTLFWEGYLYDDSGSNISFALSDTTAASSNTNQIGWDSTLRPFYNISNTRTNDISRLNNGIVNRFLMQYNNGILNCYVNGINVWTNQAVPVFDYRYLVLNSGGSSFATDRISIWPRTLSNTESVRITTKMVAYYKLDSNSVDTLRLNNGIDTSISYATVGKVGNSATFNVASSFISVPQSTDFDFSNNVSDIPFSVSMWINKTAATGTYMVLLAKETATLSSFNIRFGSGAGNQLEVVLATSAGNYKWWQYPGTYTNATWYHLVVTYDGSAKDSGVKLYINNVLKTPNMQNLGTYVKMPTIKAPLSIGQSGYGGNRFNGKMDELGIWKDYILSTLEINDLYNKGLAGLPIL